MTAYIKIEFPADALKIRRLQNRREIFDPIRKRWVALSPEEWVRQHFLQFLLTKNYPASLIAVEKKILLGELTKRCDIVVYTRDMKPFMIIECKKTGVPLNQKVLEQILRYNINLQPPYLIVTNGEYTIAMKKENGQFVPVDIFPEYR